MNNDFITLLNSTDKGSGDAGETTIYRESNGRSYEKPQNGRKRKLILHLDIRNTVLVADSVTHVKVEQALNSFLTSVAWGREEGDRWTWQSDQLSLTPPAPGTITYYKHLERELVKTPSDRGLLRRMTGDFTQRKIGEDFESYFTKHLNLLRWNAKDDPKLVILGCTGTPYHYILPSIYKLIHHLNRNKRDFAIVFRTFGLDASNVITSLEHGLEGSHPDFPTKVSLPVHHPPGRVVRSDDGCIVFDVFKSYSEDIESSYKKERDIYNMLSASRGISGFKDDFPFWQNRAYHYKAGKPLWVDPYDQDVHHIIIDDNMRTDEEDNIVNLKLFDAGPGCEISRDVSREEATRFEDACMVQADLLRSIQDIDYFVHSIDKCEDKYSKFLHEYHNGSL